MNEQISCTTNASSRKFCASSFRKKQNRQTTRTIMSSWQAIQTKRSLGDFWVTQSLSRRHEGKNPYPARGKPILRFLWINNQNYWPIGGIRHIIFSVKLYTGSLWLFILFFKPQYWYVCKFLKEADCQHADDTFWLFYGLKSLNGRNSTLYIYLRIGFVGVLVFVITKTKRGLC